MDVTVRVKDFLHILNAAGLIEPVSAHERYPPFLADINSVLFPNMSSRPGLGGTRGSIGTPIAELGGLRDLLALGGNTPSPLPTMPTIPQDALAAEPGLMSPKAPSPPDSVGVAAAFSPVPTDRSAQGSPEVSDAEVLACDFKLTFLEVLQLICEVSSSDSASKLCWAVKGEDGEKEEKVGVLDFVETELTFCEFQRLLLRISESKTQCLDPAISSGLPLHRRLQGFLKHVFLPSLEPQEEPAPQEAAADDAEGAEVDPDAAETPAAEAPAAAEVAPATDSPLEPIDNMDDEHPKEVRPFNPWQGFEGKDLYHCQEAMSAPRAWPQDYELSVSAW